MENKSPIFVVGSPRSGTTLMTAFLSSHSSIAAGPETHFYNKLALNDVCRDADVWPSSVLDVLSSIHLRGRDILELYSINEQDLLDDLRHKTPSTSAVLQAIMLQMLQVQNKTRWLEKTPNHLLHLAQIRKDFPDAFIIRMVRDHRDLANSMKKLPWAFESAVANAPLIEDWHKRSHEFCENDKKCITLSFEALVSNPSLCLESVCEFIGEQYEATVLNRNSAVLLTHENDEPWKREIENDIDSSKASAWQIDGYQDKYSCIDSSCQQYACDFEYAKALPEAPEQGTKWPSVYCSLLMVRNAKYAKLDSYAARLNQYHLCLSNNENLKYTLLFFEGSLTIDLKLIVKSLYLSWVSDRKILYLAQHTDGIVKRLFACALFTQLEKLNIKKAQ